MTNESGTGGMGTEIERAAAEAAAAPRPADGLEAARALMAEVFRVAERARRDASFRGKPLRELVARTAPALRRAAPALGYWLVVQETGLWGTWSGSWEDVSRARSALASLHEMYGGTEMEDALAELSGDEMDEALRSLAPVEGGVPDAEVPAGIPGSHWWWWAPSDPPPARAAVPSATPGR